MTSLSLIGDRQPDLSVTRSMSFIAFVGRPWRTVHGCVSRPLEIPCILRILLGVIRIVVAVLLSGVAASTATPHATAQRSHPKQPLLRTEPAAVTCPAPLGSGVRTARLFCDVLAGRNPASGIIIRLPKHQGVATLTFDLHNRQTYSAEQVKSGNAYTRYTATIGVLTLDSTLLSRFVVQSEFRREGDLFDRIAGGSGPGGVKAVAPTGVEPVRIDIPANVEAVSILGEKLTTTGIDGHALYTTAGRPIAVISQAMIEYRPVSAPAPTAKKPAKKTKP